MDKVVGSTSLILEVLTQQQSFKNYSYSAKHFCLPFLIIFLSRQSGKNIHATKISAEVSSHAWVSELCWTQNWLCLSRSSFLEKPYNYSFVCMPSSVHLKATLTSHRIRKYAVLKRSFFSALSAENKFLLATDHMSKHFPVSGHLRATKPSLRWHVRLLSSQWLLRCLHRSESWAV